MATHPTLPPDSMLNLSKYHREHEKFYAQDPLHKALQLQQASRILLTLADRWTEVHASDSPSGNPYLAAEDLNETATIQHTGVLFMEGEGEPVEITRLKRDLRTMAEDFHDTGEWLATAMQSSWEIALHLLTNPAVAGILGERHRIISNDWQNASNCSMVARLLSRSLEILGHVGLSSGAVRNDLNGPRVIPQYLYSASELIDRAADVAAESAILIHDNERRWRAFAHALEQAGHMPDDAHLTRSPSSEQ